MCLRVFFVHFFMHFFFLPAAFFVSVGVSGAVLAAPVSEVL